MLDEIASQKRRLRFFLLAMTVVCLLFGLAGLSQSPPTVNETNGHCACQPQAGASAPQHQTSMRKGSLRAFCQRQKAKQSRKASPYRPPPPQSTPHTPPTTPPTPHAAHSGRKSWNGRFVSIVGNRLCLA